MTTRADLGLVGLGTMGSNLALNLGDHGVTVAAYDVAADRARAIADDESHRIVPSASLAELVSALEPPRRIWLMVPAGKPVDDLLKELVRLLQKGDVVLDGGNSHWADTQRRGDSLASKGIHFVGIGVSGGAEGARHGPSLMPGGPPEAYESLRPVLEAIAARTELGPCVAWLGPGGAGHFVKAVHNGIEYADMQAIAEAYDLLHRGAGLESTELGEAFAQWNAGPLESFLVEITAGIFSVVDPETGESVVEGILDQAEQKGTGRWTGIAALELGAPATAILAAVDARVVSSRRTERLAGSQRLTGPAPPADRASRGALTGAARDALHATRMCALAQGFELLAAASDEHRWDVPRAEVARVWTGGCIIRSRLLEPIRAALLRDPAIPNLLLDPDLAREIAGLQDGWRRAIAECARRGIPAPCWSAALAWYDGVRAARLPHNLTQAQRDWFGAHRFRRLADPEAAPQHVEWAEFARIAREGE